MRSHDEDVAWRRLQDVQREAENRRLIAAGGPAMVGGVGFIAEIGWGFVHALGLAPRWWAHDAADGTTPPDASEPRPVRRQAPRRRLAPRG